MRRGVILGQALALAGLLGGLGFGGMTPAAFAQGKGPNLQQRVEAAWNAAHITRDLEYARPDGKPLALDLYRPPDFQGKLPVIVFIHGGGWKSGSRAKPYPAVLISYGYAVASIDYRLSQDAPFPAQIQDCKAAVRWLRAHAEQYQLDPDRIGAWGNSAGAHLAALLGLAGDKSEWDVGDHRDQSSRVQAVCDFFGPTDLTGVSGPRAGEGAAMIAQLLGGPLEEKAAEAREASPLNYVSKGDPPFFIAHGANDDLVPVNQSIRLHKALQARRVPSALLIVRNARHGFSPETVPPQGQIYLQALAFFNTTLRRGRK